MNSSESFCAAHNTEKARHSLYDKLLLCSFHLMDFDLNTIVHRERDTSSGYHLLMGRGWRIIGESGKLHSPLAYSAFEFRCAIERALIELFLLIRKENFSQADIKSLERFSSLRTAIIKSAGGKRQLDRMIAFNRIISEGSGAPPNTWTSRIDIGVMEHYWSALSEYCHRQLKPKSTWKSMGDAWLIKGYKLLNEVENYLWEIMVNYHIGWVQPDTLEPEALQARTEFVNGTITESDLKTRLSLMSPVLEQRFRERQR